MTFVITTVPIYSTVIINIDGSNSACVMDILYYKYLSLNILTNTWEKLRIKITTLVMPQTCTGIWSCISVNPQSAVGRLNLIPLEVLSHEISIIVIILLEANEKHFIYSYFKQNINDHQSC